MQRRACAGEPIAQLPLGIVSEGDTGPAKFEMETGGRCLYWAPWTRKMFSKPYLSFYLLLLKTTSRRYSGITARARGHAADFLWFDNIN